MPRFPLAIDVRLPGAPGLRRDLERLEPKLQRLTLRRAMRAGAKIWHKEALTLVPERTGALRRSLKVRAARRSRSFIAVQVNTSEGALFGGETFYAGFQEFGWKAGPRSQFVGTYKRGKKVFTRKFSGGRKQIEGEHYLEFSFEARKLEVLTAVTAEIGKALDKELGERH